MSRFLSIITCTYNSGQYLAQTIASVEQQNLDPDTFEHIFIDAESQDNTIDIIKSYQTRNPSYTIRVISQKPAGIYNAMNKGISISQWEYILFLHSDDFLVAHSLTPYISFIQKTWNKDLYFAQKYNYSDASKTSSRAPGNLLWYLWIHGFLLCFVVYISQPTVLHRRDLFDRVGCFDEQYRVISDMIFYANLGSKISYRYYHHPMTHFRIHEKSTSSSSSYEPVIREISRYVYTHYPRFLAWLMVLWNILYYRFILGIFR